jgi:hypothetical protein
VAAVRIGHHAKDGLEEVLARGVIAARASAVVAKDPEAATAIVKDAEVETDQANGREAIGAAVHAGQATGVAKVRRISTSRS